MPLVQRWDDWNIMGTFRSGGLRGLGNTVSVSMPLDKDGYLGRECPNSDCEQYFKVTPGTGIKGPAPCHCPYCGHTGESKTFFTPEQNEYLRSIVRKRFTEALREDLKAIEFEHKPKGMFGIGISMKLQPGAPVPIRWYQERNLETGIICDQCSLRYAIYGVFGWCPDCGIHNSLQILSKNLELARKKLVLAESVDGELAETVVADALAGVISAFDGFGRELCSHGETKASFQNLDGGRKRVLQEFKFDMAETVSEEEWVSACRSFQKRHLLAHRMGVIDEEYVRKASDPGAVVGRKITLVAAEIGTLIDIVERLGKRLYGGVMPRADAR